MDTLVLTIVGGFVPALLWLWFWLKEDEHPEPNRFLALAFIGGMAAIPAALILEFFWLKIVEHFATGAGNGVFSSTSLILITGFAFVEEYVKYFFAYALVFWRKDYDEPVDAMVYLITTALGFAAVENVFYLLNPFSSALLHGFTTTGLRFLGPTLLHALASGLLGYFIAGSYFRTRFRRETALAFGLLWATVLHAGFNISIILSTNDAGITRIEPVLVLLGIVGIIILFSFERVKHKIIR
ncbi:MAG: PrsW family glutamic-type intramembrane protease [bacterium]|nr:PrsW family glutamic-type intramembrane protease [bacterium]